MERIDLYTSVQNAIDKVKDDAVAKLEKDWINQIDEQMNEKIGVLENTLYISDPENIKDRWNHLEI